MDQQRNRDPLVHQSPILPRHFVHYTFGLLVCLAFLHHRAPLARRRAHRPTAATSEARGGGRARAVRGSHRHMGQLWGCVEVPRLAAVARGWYEYGQ
jgi:hypothetical protein